MNSGQLALLDEAGQARNQAMRAVENAMDDWTRDLIDQAILAKIDELGQASMNDCRHLVPEIGDRSKIGARMRALAMSKQIVAVDEVVSTDVATHAKKINVYRRVTRVLGTDAAVAVDRFNPDGPAGYRAATMPDAPLRATRVEAEADELACRGVRRHVAPSPPTPGRPQVLDRCSGWRGASSRSSDGRPPGRKASRRRPHVGGQPHRNGRHEERQLHALRRRMAGSEGPRLSAAYHLQPGGRVRFVAPSSWLARRG